MKQNMLSFCHFFFFNSCQKKYQNFSLKILNPWWEKLEAQISFSLYSKLSLGNDKYSAKNSKI